MEFLGCICAPAEAQFFGRVVEIYDCAEGDEDDSDAQITFGCWCKGFQWYDRVTLLEKEYYRPNHEGNLNNVFWE